LTSFLSLDYGRATDEIVRFIRDIVGGKNVVIGLSGGLDSSVTAVRLETIFN